MISIPRQTALLSALQLLSKAMQRTDEETHEGQTGYEILCRTYDRLSSELEQMDYVGGSWTDRD